jgi:hypothetical protein
MGRNATHRVVDDGSGHCEICHLSLALYAGALSHLRGTAAAAERRRLGLSPTEHAEKQRQLKHGIVRAETELARVTRERDALAERIQGAAPIEERLLVIEALIRELLARPIGIAFQPTHRRQADGGSGGRREQRQAQRAS